MAALQGILERNKYTQKIIQDVKPILSKQDGVKYFGIEVGQTVPSLILKQIKSSLFYRVVISM